jgi:hypothetical protein
VAAAHAGSERKIHTANYKKSRKMSPPPTITTLDTLTSRLLSNMHAMTQKTSKTTKSNDELIEMMNSATEALEKMNCARVGDDLSWVQTARHHRLDLIDASLELVESILRSSVEENYNQKEVQPKSEEPLQQLLLKDVHPMSKESPKVIHQIVNQIAKESPKVIHQIVDQMSKSKEQESISVSQASPITQKTTPKVIHIIQKEATKPILEPSETIQDAMDIDVPELHPEPTAFIHTSPINPVPPLHSNVIELSSDSSDW